MTSKVMMHTYVFDLDVEKMNVNVAHDQEHERFYFSTEGREGELQYKRINGDTLEFQETYLDKDIRGRGWSRELVRQALEYAKSHQVKVKPTCPLVKDYMNAHPEYQPVRAEGNKIN